MAKLTDQMDDLLHAAHARRADLTQALRAEGTTAMRLFHGVAEGRPGLTIDRYGPVVLAQVWRGPVTPAERAAVTQQFPDVVWRDRSQRAPDSARTEFQELGLTYAFQAHHRGKDPWLFLDFRAARRWLRGHAAGRTVLNTFAYTCGAGVAAAAGGARTVLNVDHGGWCLQVGQDNATRNGLSMDTLRADFFSTVRQFAGLPVKGRGRRRSFPKVTQRPWDVIVLDPPTRAVTPFGTVDLVNDYASLAKPCVLALTKRGALLATNHEPKVDWDTWVGQVTRCAAKAGRPIQHVERIDVEADFPSFDGHAPLKIGVFRV